MDVSTLFSVAKNSTLKT